MSANAVKRMFYAHLFIAQWLQRRGQVKKQDTSGNERERESETVDRVMVVSTYLFLRTTLKGLTNRSQKSQAATDTGT